MGSRSPLPRKPSQKKPEEPENFDHPTLDKRSATRRLIGRIANALQMPPSALYTLPEAVDAASQPGTLGRLEGECALLLRAFNRIRDPEERSRLLLLVQKAAEQS